MPLCSSTSAWVASGSKTTLKVKGFKLPFASSTCWQRSYMVMLMMMITAILMMMISHPYLAFSRELNDWIIVCFCLFLADRAHPEHRNDWDPHFQKYNKKQSPDNNIDVVPIDAPRLAARLSHLAPHRLRQGASTARAENILLVSNRVIFMLMAIIVIKSSVFF